MATREEVLNDYKNRFGAAPTVTPGAVPGVTPAPQPVVNSKPTHNYTEEKHDVKKPKLFYGKVIQEGKEIVLTRKWFGKQYKQVTDGDLGGLIIKPFIKDVIIYSKSEGTTDFKQRMINIKKEHVYIDLFTRWQVVDAEKLQKKGKDMHSVLDTIAQRVNAYVESISQYLDFDEAKKFLNNRNIPLAVERYTEDHLSHEIDDDGNRITKEYIKYDTEPKYDEDKKEYSTSHNGEIINIKQKIKDEYGIEITGILCQGFKKSQIRENQETREITDRINHENELRRIKYSKEENELKAVADKEVLAKRFEYEQERKEKDIELQKMQAKTDIAIDINKKEGYNTALKKFAETIGKTPEEIASSPALLETFKTYLLANFENVNYSANNTNVNLDNEELGEILKGKHSK